MLSAAHGPARGAGPRPVRDALESTPEAVGGSSASRPSSPCGTRCGPVGRAKSASVRAPPAPAPPSADRAQAPVPRERRGARRSRRRCRGCSDGGSLSWRPTWFAMRKGTSSTNRSRVRRAHSWMASTPSWPRRTGIVRACSRPPSDPPLKPAPPPRRRRGRTLGAYVRAMCTPAAFQPALRRGGGGDEIP